MLKRPNSLRHFDNALRRLTEPKDYLRKRYLLAAAIISQMFPEGALKGGSALKIRFGDQGTRQTIDLDAARISDLEDYLDALQDSLEKGWEGFTGSLRRKKPAHPENIPPAYIMQPFEVKLSYFQKPWLTIPLEISHNELGDAEMPDLVYPQEASDLLEQMGFPALSPVPLMALSYQVAQKLHALTSPDSERWRDLIDLQIIDARSELDYAELRKICERLFSYRRQHVWPPEIQLSPDFASAYEEIRKPIEEARPYKEAIHWLSHFISSIYNS